MTIYAISKLNVYIYLGFKFYQNKEVQFKIKYLSKIEELRANYSNGTKFSKRFNDWLK